MNVTCYFLFNCSNVWLKCIAFAFPFAACITSPQLCLLQCHIWSAPPLEPLSACHLLHHNSFTLFVVVASITSCFFCSCISSPSLAILMASRSGNLFIQFCFVFSLFDRSFSLARSSTACNYTISLSHTQAHITFASPSSRLIPLLSISTAFYPSLLAHFYLCLQEGYRLIAEKAPAAQPPVQ